MSLRYLIFFLCAGSSVLFDDLSAMNGGDNLPQNYTAWNGYGVSEISSNSTNINVTENSRPISPEDLRNLPNLTTLNLYTQEQIEQWRDCINLNICNQLQNVNVFAQLSHAQADDLIGQFADRGLFGCNRTVDIHGNQRQYSGYVNFLNVIYNDYHKLDQLVWNSTTSNRCSFCAYFDGITLGANFFVNNNCMSHLMDVGVLTLPQSITNIENGAFDSLQNLKVIKICVYLSDDPRMERAKSQLNQIKASGINKRVKIKIVVRP